MKSLLLLGFFLLAMSNLFGQGIADLKAAIDDPQKKVQAIHHYP